MNYEIIRSKRKTMRIKITREAKLTARAPFKTPDARIERLVAESGEWITKARKRQSLRACRLRVYSGF